MNRTRKQMILLAILMAALALPLVAGPRTPKPPRVPGGVQAQPLEIVRTAPSPKRPASGPKGKYSTLLRKLHVPNDQKSYGDFYDYGYWSGTAYAGCQNLPRGYWVYLAPHWYIFRDAGTKPTPRKWGPEQATGKPNTPKAGDISTAWASKTRDGQMEWLELTYSQSVPPLAVLVYETYNPGAVYRVSVFDAHEEERTVWSGADPTSSNQSMGISVIPFKAKCQTRRIRIYLDSPKVKGWNEIDAVGLLDTWGTTHWAIRATASSTYAE